MKTSVNRLRREFSELVQAMEMVHSFYWGTMFEATHSNSAKLNYPLVTVFYTQAGLNKQLTTINLKVNVADLVYKSDSNKNEVESDALQICRHIFNVINKSKRWNDLGKVLSCSVVNIPNTQDGIAGCEMTVQFALRDSSGVCDIPIFDYDFEAVYGSSCQPVHIYKDGLFLESVPSGGDYFVASCAPATVHNSDNSFLATVPSGGDLPFNDRTINVYVDGVLNQTTTAKSLVDLTINITS